MLGLFAQTVLLGAVRLGTGVSCCSRRPGSTASYSSMAPAGETMSLSVWLPAFAMTTATHGMTPARTIGMTASQVCQTDHTSTAPTKDHAHGA